MQFLLPVVSMTSTLGVGTAKQLHTSNSDSFISMYLHNPHTQYRKNSPSDLPVLLLSQMALLSSSISII